MLIKIRTFGVASDILGGKNVAIEVDGSSVMDLRRELVTVFPKIADLNSLFIAVNQKYAEDDLLLKETDEIALIPPVSGG